MKEKKESRNREPSGFLHFLSGVCLQIGFFGKNTIAG